MTNNINHFPLELRYLIRLLLVITVIFAAIMAKQLFVPLFFGILFAYMVYPPARQMENWGVPRILTNLILIILTIAVIGGFLYGLSMLVATFSDDLPEIKSQFEENISYYRENIGSLLGISEEQQKSMVEGFGFITEFLDGFFTATTNTIVAIGLMPVFAFFMLFYRDKFEKFLLEVVPDQKRDILESIIREAATVVPKYLKGLVVVVLILMVINSIAFYFIGIEYALLMGVIAALFNLIPYLGTIIGYAIVLLFVLVTQDPSQVLSVFLLFFPVQFFENNILTPNITGSYVRINPLVIIISLIAAGMIWGLPGMLLVIPYLAMFKILSEHVPSLQPVEYLLSTRGTEEFQPSFDKIKKWFKSFANK